LPCQSKITNQIMKISLTTLFLVVSIYLNAQITISGTVTNQKGEVIEGANAYLEGTYDGSTTLVMCLFSRI